MQNKILAAPFILGVLSFTTSTFAQDFIDNNVEFHSLNTKLESFNEEKKINKSLFLPELNLNGGIGSEKMKQEDHFETDKGPYAFLQGKLNLYNGSKDSLQIQKTDSKILAAKIEKEIKRRNLNIEAVKKLTAINLITKKNELIEKELKDNKAQQSMAKKKVDAGLTTSVDLLDFELKTNLLSNELDKNNLEKDELLKELINLNGGNFSNESLSKELPSVQLLTDLDYEHSPIIQLSKEQIQLSSLEKGQAKADYLPIVDLEAKWGQITPQHQFFNSEKEHQIALNVTIPLFSGFSTSSKIQQAVLESAQKEREARQEEIELRSKFEISKKRIDLLRKTIQILEASLAQSQKYKDLTIGEYKRGIKNSPDVISASDKRFELEQKLLDTKNELYNLTYSFNETFKSYKGE